jgi:hypothetical protein
MPAETDEFSETPRCCLDIERHPLVFRCHHANENEFPTSLFKEQHDFDKSWQQIG